MSKRNGKYGAFRKKISPRNKPLAQDRKTIHFSPAPKVETSSNNRFKIAITILTVIITGLTAYII